MLINKVLKPNILTDLIDLFFPESCMNCGTSVQMKGRFLCLDCLAVLPLTGFSFYRENPAEKTFIGRVPIQAATSLLFFDKKGMVQKILHQLKYQGKPEIGILFGRWIAADLKFNNRFQTLNTVIPVPMHPRKQRKRGYNQVYLFAQALAKELDLEFLPDNLVKVSYGKTQTKKNRIERLLDKSVDYKIKDHASLIGKHILLVDDIITSGATMEACSFTLLRVQGVQVSLASIAFTP